MSDTTTEQQGASQKLAESPAPDDPRKADDPTEIHKRSWKYVFAKTLREFTSDQCTDIAATLVYFAVLALFPALLALVSLLGVTGQGAQATDALLDLLREVGAGSAAEALQGPITQFSTSPAVGFALVTGVVAAVWSASGYVGAFSRAMNRIYEIEEGRTFFSLKPTQLLVTLIGILMILAIAIILVISGPVTDAIGSLLGLGTIPQVIWSIVKWPVLVAILVLMVAILYYFTPNVRQPKFRWISMGSLLAIVILGLASLGFGFYVANFSNYNATYGAIAGVVIFLLWLWIANLALLFGAEFDAELERGRELQAGIAAEETMKLPPRGTKKSDKVAEVERKDIAEGRRIRLANDPANRESDDDRAARLRREAREKEEGERRKARRDRIRKLKELEQAQEEADRRLAQARS